MTVSIKRIISLAVAAALFSAFTLSVDAAVVRLPSQLVHLEGDDFHPTRQLMFPAASPEPVVTPIETPEVTPIETPDVTPIETPDMTETPVPEITVTPTASEPLEATPILMPDVLEAGPAELMGPVVLPAVSATPEMMITPDLTESPEETPELTETPEETAEATETPEVTPEVSLTPELS